MQDCTDLILVTPSILVHWQSRLLSMGMSMWRRVPPHVTTPVTHLLGRNIRLSAVCRTASSNGMHSHPFFFLPVCGSQLDNGAMTISLGTCNMVCAGNSSEYCGGSNALNVSPLCAGGVNLSHTSHQVYNYTGTSLPTPPPGGGGGGGGGGGSGAPVYPVTSGLPSPWEYAACYV